VSSTAADTARAATVAVRRENRCPTAPKSEVVTGQPEVKASAKVTGKDLNGLKALRDELGDAFVAGVALHTGQRSYSPENRIHVMPVDRLWTPA
jgi:hypothetical protein